MDLSYWLAELLGVRDTVEIGQPGIFSNRVCNALKANPCSVDLRAQSQHFYTFAKQYLAWSERDDLHQIIIDTFRARVVKLADHAQNPRGAQPEDIDFLKGLDDLERQRILHQILY